MKTLYIYKEIRLTIPRRFITKCCSKHDLTPQEVNKIRAINALIDKKINQLKYTQSIAHKLLLIHTEEFTPPL